MRNTLKYLFNKTGRSMFILLVVTLNGSDSYDPDGSIVGYIWSENGQQKATGESPTIMLTTGAAHVIKLIVT